MTPTIYLTKEHRLIEIVLPSGKLVHLQALVNSDGLRLDTNGDLLNVSDENGAETFSDNVTIELIK